ncbi:MAG: 4Fe-4S dicluster domain-containing protein [Acidimicrobiales bacterium]
MSAVTGAPTVLTRGTVTIDVDTCKGCEICIAACPPRVLVMSEEVNALGYRYPRLLPGCTGCQACLQLCPDFCFEVFKYDQPIEIGAPE